MRRSSRWRGSPGAFFLLVLAAAVLGCDRAVASPSAAPAISPSAVATPVQAASPLATAVVPTPLATAVSGSGGPRPTAAAGTGEAGLVIRLVACFDTCMASPGTTILDDGQVVWEASDGSGRVLEARLTAAGLARVREAIAARPELAGAADFRAELRPGAVPIAHGLSTFRFELRAARGPVVVTSWDPDSLVDQRDQWRIPPQMDALGAFADRLVDPVRWLGVDAFAGPPRVYDTDRVLVVIDYFGGVGESGDFPADADDVDWPFGNPIESGGEPVAGENGIATRCLIIDAAGALALRKAERAAGARRPQGWFSTVDFRWRRADGFLQVSLRELLPHESGSCRDLVEPSF